MVRPAKWRGLTGIIAAFAGSAVPNEVALGLGSVQGVLMARASGSSSPPRYRLEHRRPGRIRVLAAFPAEATGRSALADQAAALSTEGRPGQLVLVEDTSGAVVTSSVLRPCHPPPDGGREAVKIQLGEQTMS